MVRNLRLWNGGSKCVKASGIDPEIYSGFAFGMGIERIAQLKFKVSDLRLYSENDVRFLSQFAKNI